MLKARNVGSRAERMYKKISLQGYSALSLLLSRGQVGCNGCNS